MSTEPQKEAAFFTTIRSWGLVRGDARVFGGVLSGVGARIGLAAAPARILFVLAALFTGGIAVVLYAAAWALLPDSQGRIIVQDFGRGVPQVGPLIAIAVLGLIGFSSLDHWGWVNIGSWPTPWSTDYSWTGGSGFGQVAHVAALVLSTVVTVAIIGGIVWFFVWLVRKSTPRPHDPNATYAQTPAERAAGMPGGSMAATGAVSEPVAEDAPDAPPDAASDDEPAAQPAPSSAFVASAATVQPAPPNSTPVYAAPPARPRPPRVPGPGAVGWLLAVAWIPLSLAIGFGLHFSDRLAVFPGVAAGVIYVAGLGVILLGTALVGRRLGFLGVLAGFALIPVVLATIYAPQLRDRYDEGGFGWWWKTQPAPVYEEPTPGPDVTVPPFDASAVFAPTYATVVLNGSCYESNSEFDPGAAIVRLASVTGDTSIDITSPSTRVVVPAGTSLQIVAESSGPDGGVTTVEWPADSVSCDLGGTSTTLATLTNPDTPTLTLRIADPWQGSMIQIEEN